MSTEALYQEAAQSIIDMDEDVALDVLKKAEAEGADLIGLLSNGYSVGMREVGDRFGMGEVFLPELIFASEVMKAVTTEIEGKMEGEALQKKGVMVLGTVAGDVHDIGKGIVASLLKTNGVDVYDIGREVPAEDFIAKAKELGADFLGSSALLTTTMVEQQKIEELLAEAGLKGKVKTLVGGAPVTQRWADKIGADAYCEDAAVTVKYINELFG
ncbi:MAG: cobalamin-dependent protein [Clostridiales Family XIII bacterium]|jgi:trimethylamine corrinoid protein|nr:cobalamin-dependent protein [Clostridiales Family XIII bacterium]